MKLSTAAIMSTFLLAQPTLGQQVTVPHEFQAGTPARAAEVNENFSALVDAVNLGIPGPAGAEGPQGIEGPAGPAVVVTDANGVVVGPFVPANILDSLSHEERHLGMVFIDTGTEWLPLVVSRNWIRWNPYISLLFDNLDCKGNAYVSEFELSEFNDSFAFSEEYAALPDRTIVKLPQQGLTTPGFLMQSKMSAVRDAAGKWTWECAPGGSGGVTYITIPLGTLPVTAPPYRVTVQ